ncbi:ATP-dependent DNA helicase [Auriculariales sp. MPI-PUGE-AT-0066]|nr:ATP-dependent DNA helicase [Auriculariales sp. MPI-PUGE-AT-0066]
MSAGDGSPPAAAGTSLDISEDILVPSSSAQRSEQSAATLQGPHARALADCQRVLNQVFGYTNWRGKQKEIVEAAIRGKDVLVIAPTGMGKSMCFQVPALADQHGVTVVVSPLLEVRRLQELNVAAHSWTSETSYEERKELEKDLSSGHPRTRLVYIAPEGLLQDRFRKLLQTVYRQGELNRFVVDETWGQEFREDYMKLGNLRQKYPDIPIMALTASATPKMCDEIVHNLRMDPERFFKVVLYVPNPSQPAQMDQVADYILNLYQRRNCPSSGMVYCRKRETCDALAELLRKKGINARPYHKGILAGTLDKTLRQWEETMDGINDKGSGGPVDVVCATVACGMGIDKGDIRYVIHFDMPKNLEGYYQETGRAGRDGQAAKCILYYSREDATRVRALQRKTKQERTAKVKLQDGPDPDRQAQKSLNALLKFIEGTTLCRHIAICRYFGEKIDVNDPQVRQQYCQKMCDICKYPQKTAARRADLSESAHISTQALRMDDLPTDSDPDSDSKPRKMNPVMRKLTHIEPPPCVQNRYYPSAHAPKRTVSEESNSDGAFAGAEAPVKRPRLVYQQPATATTAAVPTTVPGPPSVGWGARSRRARRSSRRFWPGQVSSVSSSSGTGLGPASSTPPVSSSSGVRLPAPVREETPEIEPLDEMPRSNSPLSRLLKSLDNEIDIAARTSAKGKQKVDARANAELRRTASASSNVSLEMDDDIFGEVQFEVHDKCSQKVPLEIRLEAVERLYKALRNALRNAELAERVSLQCARMMEALRTLGKPRAEWSSDVSDVEQAENALAIVQRQVGASV